MKKSPTTPPADPNEIKTAQWNAAITPRLVALRAWYSGSEWKDGIRSYLNGVLQDRREHLEQVSNEHGADQFIKGQIVMLKQIMSIPEVIDRQIELTEKNKKNAPPEPNW